MNQPLRYLCLLLVLLCVGGQARATTYTVGPGRAYPTLGSVAARLRPGDVVALKAGIYRETVRITASGTTDAPITIRGTGRERSVLDATGLDTSGKGTIPRAALQIEGAYIRVEHLEIRNARNGENAAGVRLLHSTNAVIKDCKITRCDMGIFGDDRETVTIEGCEVAFNGTTSFNGYSHNFYMHGNRVTVRGCHIHDALYGQNYKSRAHHNYLLNNRIENSNEGEVGCVDGAGDTDRPGSDTVLENNQITSKPDRTGNTRKFILFGTESGARHTGRLTMRNNTLTAGSEKICFVTLTDKDGGAVIENNIFAGSRQILSAPPGATVVAKGNKLPAGATLP